jgi:hypothetical protein
MLKKTTAGLTNVGSEIEYGSGFDAQRWGLLRQALSPQLAGSMKTFRRVSFIDLAVFSAQNLTIVRRRFGAMAMHSIYCGHSGAYIAEGRDLRISAWNDLLRAGNSTYFRVLT